MRLGQTLVSLSLVIFNVNVLLVEANESKTLSPVILIPGDGGNQLEAKWNKPEVVARYCAKKSDWNLLWLAISSLVLPGAVSCFSDNMRLVYDNKTRRTSNSPGVEVRVRDFGKPASLEILDPMSDLGKEYSHYYVDIVNALVKIGYERNHTVLGAPFDFRRAPHELGEYFTNLTKLIEETYEKNEQKATLIAHSLGAPVLHYFFNRKTQEWKDKHIEAIITISGAWAGAVKPVKVYAVGDNLGSSYISAHKVKSLQRSMGSLAFLMPSRNVWHEDEILVQTPAANYTLSNISEYFKAIPFEDGYEMYKDTRDFLYNAPPPGVKIHCMHGVGSPTTERVVFRENANFTHDPTLVKGDGDGTVNTRSLQYCLQFRGKQKQEINHKTFSGQEHLKILEHKPLIEDIAYILKVVERENMLRKRERMFLKLLNYENSLYSLNSDY